MLVVLNLRWPSSGPGLYNEVQARLTWPFESVPSVGDTVLVDAAEFAVTAVLWQLAQEPRVMIHADAARRVDQHAVQAWLEVLKPTELEAFQDLDYGDAPN